MSGRSIVIASLICCLFSCNDEAKYTADPVLTVMAAKETPTKRTNDSVIQPVSIIIQPFSDISQEPVLYVFRELKKICPDVILKKTVPLPSSAYYKPRHRYKADSLIVFLKLHAYPLVDASFPDHKFIGLTSKDISTTKDQYPDWGVMGLGECPGEACVVSTFRLSKKETSLQLFKVAIHELGHTQGLPHCEVKTCFMRDAEGGNPTGEEQEFCPKCKRVLEAKGWKFE